MNILELESTIAEEYTTKKEIINAVTTKHKPMEYIIGYGYLDDDTPKPYAIKLVCLKSKITDERAYFILFKQQDTNQTYYTTSAGSNLRKPFMEEYYPKRRDDKRLESMLKLIRPKRKMYRFHGGNFQILDITMIQLTMPIMLNPKVRYKIQGSKIEGTTTISRVWNQTQLIDSMGDTYETDFNKAKQQALEKTREKIKQYHDYMLEAKKQFTKIYNIKENGEEI